MGFWGDVWDFVTDDVLPNVPIVGGIVESIWGDDDDVSQREAAEIQQREAQNNREFQKDLSDTSIQRQVKDLREAGINPIMASRLGGASTPGGATAGNITASSAKERAMVAYARAETFLKNTLAQTEKKKQVKLTHEANSAKYQSEMDQMQAIVAEFVNKGRKNNQGTFKKFHSKFQQFIDGIGRQQNKKSSHPDRKKTYKVRINKNWRKK